MKIAFFTEGENRNYSLPRFNLNTRTDLAWQIALNAEQINIREYGYNGKHDLGIAIIPKQNRPNFQVLQQMMRESCNITAIMQEGPNDLYQDWPIDEQVEYLQFIAGVDIIYCHNDVDKRYYEIQHRDVRILQSLMITDDISFSLSKQDKVIIGGNFCQWYGGIDSYMVANQFELPIYAPSMGRRVYDEERVQNLEHLPYLPWQKWIYTLSEFRYAVHLMRTYAAGTFALNCAFLGIPCIGYESIDTQRICFPELTVKEGDLKSAQDIAFHLSTNILFERHTAAFAKKMWKEIYSEEKFLDKFYSEFN